MIKKRASPTASVGSLSTSIGRNSFLLRENGSLLLIVSSVISVMALGAYVTMSAINTNLNSQKIKRSLQQADSEAQGIAVVVSNPGLCMNGYDGAGSEVGLRFANGQNKITAAAKTQKGQDVTLPSPYPNQSGGRARYQSNFNVPNSDLILKRLYVSNAVSDPSDPKVYTASLKADLQVSGASQSVSSRTVASVKLKTDASGKISDCQFISGTANNQSVCEAMGCEYTVNIDKTGGNCTCKLREKKCEDGTFITAIAGGESQCSTDTVTLGCNAPNSYLVGFNNYGQPICANAFRCPAGTASDGAGAPTNPAECRCNNAGEIFDGTSCKTLVPVNGLCGFTKSYTPAEAALETEADLCNEGDPLPTQLSGSGPWIWTCKGKDGGADAICNASVLPTCNVAGTSTTGLGAAASPAGCFCNNGGEGWDGTACTIAPATQTACICIFTISHNGPKGNFAYSIADLCGGSKTSAQGNGTCWMTGNVFVQGLNKKRNTYLPVSCTPPHVNLDMGDSTVTGTTVFTNSCP